MEHFIIIQLTDCLSPARPSFHLACLVFIYHLPVSGRIFKAKVVDINYNVRVRPDQTSSLAEREREDVRRKQNAVVIFSLCYLFSSPASPVQSMSSWNIPLTSWTISYIEPADRERERETVRDSQQYIGLAWDRRHDRSKLEVNDRYEMETLRVDAWC